MKLFLFNVLALAACRPDVRRFIVVGDTGRPMTRQEEVAAHMLDKCAKDGCDFVLMLGDNFYYSGVESLDDPMWQNQFEKPYGGFTIPFYAALGNHDYGLFGRGFDTMRANYQVEYTRRSKLWRMPARYYQRVEGPVALAALDTTAMLFQDESAQQSETRAFLESTKARWKIAFGHHPYLSNGPHGDAGSYDGTPGAGATVKALLEDAVCGKADIYFAGHEHNLQVLKPTCNHTQLIISGSGATTTAMQSVHDSPVALLEEGYVYVVATAETLTYEVVTVDQGSVYSAQLGK